MSKELTDAMVNMKEDEAVQIAEKLIEGGEDALKVMGACRDAMVELVKGLAVHPLLILVAMQVIVVVLGCLMDPVSIMLITLPLFMPIVTALGFDPT